MSERDELIALQFGPGVFEACTAPDANGYQQELVEMTEKLADRILAAGYRRIPDDCVVVKRFDLEVITSGPSVSVQKLVDVHRRLKAALSATRHGED